MSAIKDLLSLAEIYQPAQKWIGRLTIIWTAWSVLAKFRSVQDILAFIQRAAHEINVNVGWAIDLIMFCLREAATLFHVIADALFAWVPVISLIPDDFHEAAIICFMALVPTLFSVSRLLGLSSAINAGRDLPSRYEQLLSGDDAAKVLTWKPTPLKRSVRGVGQKSAVERFWDEQRADRGRDNLVYMHDDAVKLSRRFLSVVGFKVFSLRFYLSCFLACALTFEFFYSLHGDRVSSAGAIALVWLFVVVAVAVGWFVRINARTTERRRGTALAAALAIAHSVPVRPEDDTTGDIRLLNPGDNGPIARTVAHVLKVVGLNGALETLSEPGEVIDTSDTRLVNLALWLTVQTDGFLRKELPSSDDFPISFSNRGAKHSFWGSNHLDQIKEWARSNATK